MLFLAFCKTSNNFINQSEAVLRVVHEVIRFNARFRHSHEDFRTLQQESRTQQDEASHVGQNPGEVILVFIVGMATHSGNPEKLREFLSYEKLLKTQAVLIFSGEMRRVLWLLFNSWFKFKISCRH